jgi:phage tail-like protein
MAAKTSSYLKYLPPVLWDNDSPSAPLSLGAFLLIFERFLTGLDDGPIAGASGAKYDPIQKVIADTVRLFQPHVAPAEALAWLAQWVALQFPKPPKPGQGPLSNDHDRRKAIAEIVPIYAQRGTTPGLARLLELYTLSQGQLRVVIDDGSKILLCRPIPGSLAPVSTLLSQTPLIAPQCMALCPDGNFCVGGFGLTPDAKAMQAGVWRLSRTGQYSDYVYVPKAPKEQPFIQVQPLDASNLAQNSPLAQPKAMAVDARRNPWGLYIVDVSPNLYWLTSPSFVDQAPLIANAAQLAPDPPRTPYPVAMVANSADNLWILDRGADPQLGNASTVIREVKVTPGTPPAFQSTLTHNIAPSIIEPLSMLLLPDGTLIIGDGRDQRTSPPTPADLLWVKPGADHFWPATSLLQDLGNANPLVAPTAIVQEDPTHLLVLDAGLKPITPDPTKPFAPLVAQPAAIYRVEIPMLAGSTAPPKIAPITQPAHLVYPSAMLRDAQGALYICDPGMPIVDRTDYKRRRMLPQGFTVYVHFPGAAADADNSFLLQSIADVIAEEKPVQSFAAVVSIGPILFVS